MPYTSYRIVFDAAWEQCRGPAWTKCSRQLNNALRLKPKNTNIEWNGNIVTGLMKIEDFVRKIRGSGYDPRDWEAIQEQWADQNQPKPLDWAS